MPKFGSRADVMAGRAEMTTGKLVKDDLEKRGGRIVSKRRSEISKQNYQLHKHQFNTRTENGEA